MCGLGWLCRLCVPLSLGVLRRRSLLRLHGHVRASLRLCRLHVLTGLRLHGHVRVWRLRSRVRARGLRTGVRTLCRSLALSGWGGLRLGGLCLGRPLPLGCTPLRCGGGSSTCGASARSIPLGRRSSVRPLGRNPLCLEAQRCLARRRRHITAKSPRAS